jgi:amidase
MKFEQFFAQTDVLLTPVSASAAPPHLQQGTPYQRQITVNGQARPYAEQFVWIALATVAGLPATSAPAGRTAEGLPVGVQIIGGPLQDLSTIDFARQLATVHGGYTPPP